MTPEQWEVHVAFMREVLYRLHGGGQEGYEMMNLDMVDIFEGREELIPRGFRQPIETARASASGAVACEDCTSGSCTKPHGPEGG